MIRNLKALGLVLAAVFALGAVLASAASAQTGELTSDGPVTLIGEEKGVEGENALTAFGESVECPNSKYTGHKYNVTPHQLIPVGATTVTLTPHYNQPDCIAHTLLGPKQATVDMNGCDYVLHVGETTVGKEDEYGVRATIICPKEKHIVVTVFNSEVTKTEGVLLCMLTVVENEAGYTGADLIHTTSPADDIDLKGTFKGLTVKKSGLCGAKETAEAEFHANVTVTGRNAEGESTPVTITHK